MTRTRILRTLVPLLRLRGWEFPAIVLLGLVQSLAEGVGIGLFIPLLGELLSGAQPRAKGQFFVETMETLFQGVAPERRLAIVGVCLFAAVLTTALLTYLYGLLFAWIDGNVGHQLRRRIFAQLLSVSFGFLERDRSGRLLNILSSDTWRTSEALQVLAKLMVTTSTIVVYVVLLLLLSWRLTLLVAVGLIVISTTVRVITRGVRGLGEKMTRANAELADRMVEGIDGMRVVRAFGRERYAQANFDRTSDQVRLALLRIGRLEEAVHPAYEILAASLLLIIVFVTARASTDVSTLLVFAFVLYRLQPRVKDFDVSRVRLAALGPSLEEVVSLLDTSDKRYVRSGAVACPNLERDIVFDRVSYRYSAADDAALMEASFRIPAGQTTAFVGPSGGGKSTVAKLILRFDDPTQGAISVDGRRLPDLDLDSWRGQIALVSQDVYLFNATVRENIAYGRLEAGRDEIIEAARKADAHDFIERLPHKYDTVLGHHGVRLSGGQQQRIALARAIVRNARILILDEATNALDSISEHWIQDTLEKLRKHRTVILIAHRLSTIERADQIIVLDKGRVEGIGTLPELIEADGLFARLYQLQQRRSPVANR